MTNKGHGVAHASPTKRFFVEMLTRDIDLEDAILDLLDNCVDGILRKEKDTLKKDRPYEGYYAEISFTGSFFRIKDNCGGIPKDLAERYAFMLGRPKDEDDSDVPTVGMYGIGMKRALFKLGSKSKVVSQTANEVFEVNISKKWLTDDSDWTLPLNDVERSFEENGTFIEVCDLRSGVAKRFSKESDFPNKFPNMVAENYSYIIYKGFTVKINGKTVIPKPFKLLWTDSALTERGKSIAPFLYKATLGGVDVSLAIGFYAPPTNPDEEEQEQKMSKKTDYAGWTILCNDRVVVYCDKNRLTGWGEAGVPNYHTQFIAISGVVEFKCNDAWKLPVTTTKRGIDSSADIYLYIKDIMRQGLKKFTSYTNKWKDDPIEERKVSKNSEKLELQQIFSKVPEGAWLKVKNRHNELKFSPDLPEPSKKKPVRRIVFTRAIAEIEQVSEFLFDDSSVKPSDVGSKCFEKVLMEAKKR